MAKHDGSWLYKGRGSSRLWDKSALGKPSKEDGILLSAAEIIFCIGHRGIEISEITGEYGFQSWLNKELEKNPSLLQESAILEALRVPGNKIVLSRNWEYLGMEGSSSWALRWSSDMHPTRDEPISEIKWFYSKDSMKKTNDDEQQIMKMLLEWSINVNSKNRVAEVLVIDDEQSVVTYRLKEADPIGKMQPPSIEVFQELSDMNPIRTGKGDPAYAPSFYQNVTDWPTQIIGVPILDGYQLDEVEIEIITNIDNEKYEFSTSASILMDLWKRGLNTRSGFKYGTKWRCYPSEIGDGHAPWLVVDPSTEGPTNWAEACLSSRLASGVNKHWIYPINIEGKWRYLEIQRPPSDSRWSNPVRR